MVSRRNFIAITTIMGIILFLFLFSGTTKDRLNEYMINGYADECVTDITSKDSFSINMINSDSEISSEAYVYIGDFSNETGNTVRQWSTYSKRKIKEYNSFEEWKINYNRLPKVVLLDSQYVDWNSDTGTVDMLIGKGVNIIFCNMPSFDIVAQNERLQTLLGITYVQTENVELTGVDMYSGFLLGGVANYVLKENDDEDIQDLELNIPWYITRSGTKRYVSGIIENNSGNKIENEDFPSIIWRNRIDGSAVFAVNGDYLKDSTGLGILNAFMYEMDSYDIYPIINSQTLFVSAYPCLTEENTDVIQQNYSRNSTALMRDIIWTGLISLKNNLGSKLTCAVSPQLNYDDALEPDKSLLEYYFKLISEQNGEVALTYASQSKISGENKASRDNNFFKSYIPDYKFTAYYAGKNIEEAKNVISSGLLRDVNTIVGDYDESKDLVSYATEDITVLRSISNGYRHTFSDDMRLRSIQTALGYSLINIDIQNVLYPEDSEDSWENYFKAVSSNVLTYWKPFKPFAQTTISESNKRVREFLALDFTKQRRDNIVSIDIDNFKGEAWFILRTHGESIEKISGANYKMIERDAYLLEIKSEHIEVELKEEN